MGAPATAERIEWGQSADLPQTQVLLVDDCARRWQQYHETYTVCTGLSIRQPAEWKYRARRHLQTADGVMLMEPGEVHVNTRITDVASFRVLMIQPAVFRRMAAELGARFEHPHLKVAQLHGGPLHRAFVALHRSLEGEATVLERQSRFAACIQLLLEQCAEKPPAPASAPGSVTAVQRAREYLEAHYAEPVSLEALTAAAGDISRFHLVRAFGAQVGLTPHAYLLHLRITRARALLAARMPPVDVAATLGFADQSHFTRHFARVVGVTPSRYARQAS